MSACSPARNPAFRRSRTLLNFGERVKRSWEDSAAAPLPHAELLSLKELSIQAKVPYETAVERLEARGFKGIRPEAIVQELAQTNQVSAQRVYEIVQGQRGGGRGGGGHGLTKGGESGAQAEKGAGTVPAAAPAVWQGRRRWRRRRLADAGAILLGRDIALTNATARLQAKGIKFPLTAPCAILPRITATTGLYEIIDIVGGTKP